MKYAKKAAARRRERVLLGWMICLTLIASVRSSASVTAHPSFRPTAIQQPLHNDAAEASRVDEKGLHRVELFRIELSASSLTQDPAATSLDPLFSATAGRPSATPSVWLRQGSSRSCTSILVFRAGVSFDRSHGGSAARAALLATCLLIDDPQPGLGTIHCWPEIGGDDAAIWIRHRCSETPRLLDKIQHALGGTTAATHCGEAISRLREVAASDEDPCPCLMPCNCRSLQRLRHRTVEALDPLATGTRRSGCPRRVKTLSPAQVDQWRIQHLHGGSMVLLLETCEDLTLPAVRLHIGEQVRQKLRTLSTAPMATDPLPSARSNRGRNTISPGRNTMPPGRSMIPLNRTIVSPGWIEVATGGESLEQIVAGWPSDPASPPDSIPLLDPRVELWREAVKPRELPRIALLRLLARRCDARLATCEGRGESNPADDPIHLALEILRSKDPVVGTLLSRQRRRAPVITVLRRQYDP